MRDFESVFHRYSVGAHLRADAAQGGISRVHVLQPQAAEPFSAVCAFTKCVYPLAAHLAQDDKELNAFQAKHNP